MNTTQWIIIGIILIIIGRISAGYSSHILDDAFSITLENELIVRHMYYSIEWVFRFWGEMFVILGGGFILCGICDKTLKKRK